MSKSIGGLPGRGRGDDEGSRKERTDRLNRGTWRDARGSPFGMPEASHLHRSLLRDLEADFHQARAPRQLHRSLRVHRKDLTGGGGI